MSGRAWPIRLAWLAVPAVAAACNVPGADPDPIGVPVTPDVYELANIRHSNIVPKSSPATLVATFETYCLDGPSDVQRVAAKLRAADFVAVPKDQPSAITAFVVDDSRPLVMLSDDGRTCAVVAKSRTGQTTRIQRMIASRFPGAKALDPAAVSDQIELAVQITGARAGVIFVKRLAPSISNSRLILGILRQG